jgi:hypothetical protein
MTVGLAEKETEWNTIRVGVGVRVGGCGWVGERERERERESGTQYKRNTRPPQKDDRYSDEAFFWRMCMPQVRV